MLKLISYVYLDLSIYTYFPDLKKKYSCPRRVQYPTLFHNILSAIVGRNI